MHPSHYAAQTPDKPAYIMEPSGEVVTFGQLDARSNQGAHFFRSLGLKRGDGIAFCMENNARFYEICWAAQRSGLYFTAISSRLTASEIDYIVRDCDARVFITSESKKDVAGELKDLLPAEVKRYAAVGPVEGYESWETTIAAFPETPIADESPGTDMLYSSGTTGRPKGVRIPLPEGELNDESPLLMLLKALYNFDENSIYLSPAPLYHAAPLRYNMMVNTMGATNVIMEKFDPEEYLRLVEKHKITNTQLVPTMFVRMLKLPEDVRNKYDVSSLKGAIHAAAPCPIPIKKQMIDWWGPVIFEYYAGTEGNGFCTINTEEWLAHEGSVGKPLVGELHICDEDGNEVPTGEAGTVYFANGNEFSYWKDDEKTKESRNDKGWSTLGDVGYVDEEGYLYLTDRKAFMIISGGVNIYPQETENLLITHPKVADVAVIGVPNEEFGEEVKAVVQPANWLDAGPDLEAELIEFCRRTLSHIKCPKSVDFDKELPRHPTGKLYKRLVRDRYWGKSGSKIV